jgi:nucleotide-binding universal stress UspA family protein
MPMYKTIYVPVDNSDHSNQAVAKAVELGKRFDARMVGCHVYAARMHDYRFKQMEFTLPEEYLEETELERQRKIHDSLITMGLKLISESYLTPMGEMCKEAGLEFEPRMMDGKHSTELLKDIERADYDLVVIGAVGMGRTRSSQLGSVCERVARHAGRDVLVVKRIPGSGPAETSRTILVGIDGSPQSFGALVTAIELAKRFGRKVEAIAVYDPYLHYSVFQGIVGVLTEKAAKVFRFEEQNQLHEEIIDTGLAKIYQSHLEVAEKLAKERGFEISKTLLDGKAFQKILDHVEKTKPELLVLGRYGIHSPEGEKALGSNAENLLRLCPCDLLLTTKAEVPALDARAEESIRWTAEAEARFRRVPPLVRGIARTATLRLAVEKGHSVISSSVLDEAMERYMPKSAARAAEKLAESLVLETSKERTISICERCGVTASEENPAKCTVCGGTSFQAITPEMVREIIAMEGGAAEEAAYDGRKLVWTRDARRALATIQDGYKRRRTKARIEKSARLKRMTAVTLEFARALVEEETGATLVLPKEEAATDGDAAGGGKKLVARDEKKNPLFSSFDWTDDAVARILRVPAGFMRDRTQQRIEVLAGERDRTSIDLALVEEGIEFGRQQMAEMLGQYQKDAAAVRGAVPEAATAPRADAPREAPDGRDGGTPLNEVSAIGRLAAKRQGPG